MNDILLVDDEQAVLQSLSAALDWTEYGFAHVHMACGADEALRILKEHPVSLLILDIQMPKMTGLELLKIIRTKYPDTHSILISAHSKFEYAKEALQLNVENYLLKPIDINELRETVTHAAENIAKASVFSHNLFERNLLERWLYGRITSDELLEHSQYTHYNVLLRHYYATIIQAKENISSILRSLVSALPHGSAAYTLNTGNDSGILLFGGHDISDVFIEEAASSINAIHSGIRIACGSCAIGSGDVSKSLADARHVSEYARLAGYSGYLAYDRIDWSLLSPGQLYMLNDLFQPESSESPIRNFISGFTGSVSASEDNYRNFYAQTCLALIHMAEKHGIKNISPAPFHAPYTQAQFESLLKETLLLFSREKHKYTQSLTPIIQRVVRYISDNLSSAVSIKNFCEQTNMNPTYIGRLFREELGMYFSEYVCELRINKAKLLLENTTSSVSDIARQVGMYDVSYFVQCFKKKERISPMKYRQTVLQKR